VSPAAYREEGSSSRNGTIGGKRVVPSDVRAFDFYRDLATQHSHSDFPELLTGKADEVAMDDVRITPSTRRSSTPLFSVRYLSTDERPLSITFR